MSAVELLPDLVPTVRFGWPGRLFLVLLIAGVPILASLQPAAVEKMELPPRSALYASAISVVWILAGLTGGVLLMEGVPLAAIGLHGGPVTGILGWALAAAFGSLLSSLVITRVGARLGARESRLAFYLIPTDARERGIFLWLSVSAGFCEELVYHGFVLAGLAAWLESGWLAAAIANLAFGVLHGYQNTVGIVRAGVMGMILSVPVIVGAGLVPGMIAHFLVDAALGLGAWQWIVPPEVREPPETTR